ncbi:MAG: glycosyltransferase [Deltaproteobacteria bacterium]|nr:glycosyltransferase [Deltaproteobacteria bacterium]MBW2071179.1 glycosyltransferase [Deltaproteobacteria bacterium]
MRVSIVIPAYNAASTIGQTVQWSLEQANNGCELEVIVVDDGSTDDTAIVAAAHGARVISQVNQGPAAARNRGWHEATGSIVCFTDADCIPCKNWLANLLQGFRDWRVGAVAGSYHIANAGSWLARWVHREIIERHNRMPATVRAFGSYNVAMPRYILAATGGFNTEYPQASGEDTDLSYRIIKGGWHIVFVPEARVAHYHPENLWRYLKEQFRHGYWRAKLYTDHPEMIAGDDYTLLKDRVEPLFVLATTGLFLLFGSGFAVLQMPLWLTLVCYAFLQLIWPLKWGIAERKLAPLPYAGVTFVRGFVRTGGLALGALRFGKKFLVPTWFKANRL